MSETSVAEKTTAVAQEAFRNVANHEAIKRDEHEKVYLEVGESYPQGDVHFTRIARAPKKLKPWVGNQMAPGTSQGARHMAVGECELATVDETEAAELLAEVIPATKEHRQFFGPYVKGTGEWGAEHPDHGDRTFNEGHFLTTYQRTWAKVEAVRTID